MDIWLLVGGLFAVTVLVLADRVDAIVDYLHTSDDPLTDFDAELDGRDDDAEDSRDPVEDPESP